MSVNFNIAQPKGSMLPHNNSREIKKNFFPAFIHNSFKKFFFEDNFYSKDGDEEEEETTNTFTNLNKFCLFEVV